MTVEILAVNLDSLYLTVHGTWRENMLSVFKAAKTQAQDEDENQIRVFSDNRIAGGPFFVSRSGRSRDYSIMLFNARFRLQLSTRGGRRPVALIQVRSDLLYEYELPQINTMVIRLLDGIFDDYTFRPGRVDICCDFQSAKGEEWHFPEVEDVHSRAKWDALWRENRKTTGMTFGKHQGALQAQIYRKSETLARDSKQWMFEVWAAENERFDPEKTVYRVELRFYREGLRLMKDSENDGINSLWNLHESLNDLVSYAIGEEKPWIRACDPNHRPKGDSHQNRRRNAGWWIQVRDAFLALKGSQSRKRLEDDPTYRVAAARKRIRSHLARLAGILKVHGYQGSLDPCVLAREAMYEEHYGDARLWKEVRADSDPRKTTFEDHGPARWIALVEEKAAEYIGSVTLTA